MNKPTDSPTPPSAIHELEMLFGSLKMPYDQTEIVRFNLAYQRVYPCLSRTEKRRAEQLVDALIDDLEQKGLASKIYGVV